MPRTLRLAHLVASLVVVGAGALLAACTVTTTNQPDAIPDPTASAAQAATSAAPADSMKLPDFSNGGEAPKPNPSGKDDGADCAKGDECKSGTCEGEGCTTGKCVPSTRMCTRDLVQYCGCDGKTFSASGSCPGRLYRKKGAC